MKRVLLILLAVVILTPLSAQSPRGFVMSQAVNYDRKPGFVTITELTGAAGLNNRVTPFSAHYFGITTEAAWQFNAAIKAGVGAGIHRHNDATLFPLFLDARYSFNAARVVPFVAAAGGVAVSLDNFDKLTAVYVSPSAGLRFLAANRTGVSLSAGLLAMSSGGGGKHYFLNCRLGLELKLK